jgi:Fe2+ transport system protein FeoA
MEVQTSSPPPAGLRPSVPLTAVAAGTLATLDEIRVPECRALLRSLGLTSSCLLRICQTGDPCIVQVRATRIGLSRAVAQHVYVRAVGADAR